MTFAGTAAEILRDFRRLDPEGDPGWRGRPADEVHGHGAWMAPGGPLLAEAMGDRLALKPGERVLDIGCGRGQSSIFLTSRYGVRVVSVDLWVPVAEREGSSRIAPLQGDIGRGLPEGTGDFDAIYCQQAFHCFGTSRATVRYLASLLRPGGRLCFAQGCFREEPGELPALFRDTGGWQADYHRYHSPGWWRDHLAAATDSFQEIVAEELVQGQILWEDDVLYRGERAGWSEAFLSSSAWLIRQIAHGQARSPTLTHCMVNAVKKGMRQA